MIWKGIKDYRNANNNINNLQIHKTDMKESQCNNIKK